MVFAVAGGNQSVGGYSIDNSLRFEGNNTNLSKTFSSAGNRYKWTYSGWFKLAQILTTENKLFGAAPTTNPTYFQFSDNNAAALTVAKWNGGGHDFRLTTNRLFRDVGAWYHLVVAFDTQQATASNRVKIYVNGVQETSFHTSVYPSQNYQSDINNNVAHYVGGTQGITTGAWRGYQAEINFIDGQQLDPTDFGEFDTDSGIWKPIAYTGSYGSNGFYLDFENSASLGADSSGNSNNFSVSGPE